MTLTPQSSQEWATYVTAILAFMGFILTLLKVGASAVRSNAAVAQSVGELSQTVRRIENRMEGYIANEEDRDGDIETWRRNVDSRLSTIEATLAMLTSRMGRRRTDKVS